MAEVQASTRTNYARPTSRRRTVATPGSTPRQAPASRQIAPRQAPVSRQVTPRVTADKQLRRLPIPKYRTHYTLVLDLDETLIYTEDNVAAKPQADSFKIMGEYNSTMRPYAKEFLQWAGEYFNSVRVWTAATPDYAREVVAALQQRVPGWKIDGLWTRDHCETLKLGGESLLTKPIRKLMSEGVEPSSVVIVDDSEHNFYHNPSSGILIPKYHGEQDDDCLARLAEWFSSPQNSRAYDARSLAKDRIFD